MSIGLPYSCFFCPNLILSVRYIWEKTDYLWRVIYKNDHLNAPSVGFADTSQRGGDVITPVTPSPYDIGKIFSSCNAVASHLLTYTRHLVASPSRGKWHEVPIGALL